MLVTRKRTWRSWARDQISQSFDQFCLIIGRTIIDPGVDEIHDLRISIRRLRQVLDLCQKNPQKRLRRNLRKLLRLAGALRDCDIALMYFEKTDLSELKLRMQRKRIQAEEALVKFLSRHAHDLRVLSEEEIASSSSIVRNRIELLSGRFFRLGEKAGQTAAGLKQLHRARIAARKLRYTLEVFRNGQVSTEPDILESFQRMQRMQRLLGEINDIRTVLKPLSGDWRNRKIEERLRRKQAKKICSYQKFWMDQMMPERDVLTQRWLQMAGVSPIQTSR